MLKRRSLIGSAALLPAIVAAARAEACSFAVPSPEGFARRIPDVQQLLKAWFERDRAAFLAPFYRPPDRPDTSGDMLLTLAKADADGTVLPAFEKLFTDTARPKQINVITIVGDRAFVSVTEHHPHGIGPDCSNAPTRHLLLISFGHLRPMDGITVIESSGFSGWNPAVSWIG